jgi:hypothetical protein
VNKLAVVILSVGLMACSKKKPEEGREPAQAVAPGAIGSAATPTPAPAAAPATGSAAGSAESGSAAPAAPGSAATGSAATP